MTRAVRKTRGSKVANPQNYPRIEDPGSPSDGLLDDARLVPHTRTIPHDDLVRIIKKGIEYANQKSSRRIFEIPDRAKVVYDEKG